MPTFDLDDREKKAVDRALDRYQAARDNAANELAQATQESVTRFDNRIKAARGDYQVSLADLAEGRGLDPKTVSRYEVDRVKGTISFTVVQEAAK